MHNGVVDAMEAGIDWYAEIGPTGSTYSGGGNGKGNKFLAVMDSTITTLKFKLEATNARTYKARLFEKGTGNVLGTQVGSTLSTTGSTTGTETLTFTATDWSIVAGTQYLAVVFDDTGAAVTGYYVGDPDFYAGGAVTWSKDASVYTDATPTATESYTNDNDCYVMSLAGKITFPM